MQIYEYNYTMTTIISGFLSGIGVFIFAIYLLNTSLSETDFRISEKTEKRINNPFFGFFAGIFSSMLTQSSSAVNSVAVQLSDKKIIKDESAYFVVMGTNIGTTVTAYIAILSTLKISEIFISLIFFSSIGLMAIKNKKLRLPATWISVFSMIFIGLKIISQTIPSLTELIGYEIFIDKNPIYLLIISTLITALCQSSSLVSVVVVTLSGLGAVSIEGAIFMIIGANVGTCSTAMLAAVGKSKDGVNVAMFNLVFNILGLIVHVFAYYTGLLNWFIDLNVAPDTKIALYHTFFNVSSVLFAFPFVKEIGSLLNFSFPKRKRKAI